MTKLLIMSDNHGSTKRMIEVLKKEHYDISIHLGDSDMSSEFLKQYFNYFILGNNDFNGAIEEKIIQVEGFNILLMHGHQVFTFDRTNQTKFAKYAASKNADILLFGHYHFPIYEKINNKIIINPGSIVYPRNGSKPSYAILELDNKKIKILNFKIC